MRLQRGQRYSQQAHRLREGHFGLQQGDRQALQVIPARYDSRDRPTPRDDLEIEKLDLERHGPSPVAGGLEFNTQREAEVEAAKSLANLAKDFASIGQDVSVEVRTDVERVFQAAFIFDRSRTKQ
jgi:hypothetical protein